MDDLPTWSDYEDESESTITVTGRPSPPTRNTESRPSSRRLYGKASAGAGAGGARGMSDEPTVTMSPITPAPVDPMRVSFKQLTYKGAASRYDVMYVRQGQPLYIGRKKALKALEATIKERKGKQYSPTASALSALLSSKGAHAMIEFLRVGARPGVHRDGFYLCIFPKKNGKPPTNPLWKLNETGQDWKQQDFTTDPILLRRKDRYCIGGQFHFKIGSSSKPSTQKTRRGPRPPKPLSLAPASVTGDPESDSDA